MLLVSPWAGISEPSSAPGAEFQGLRVHPFEGVHPMMTRLTVATALAGTLLATCLVSGSAQATDEE